MHSFCYLICPPKPRNNPVTPNYFNGRKLSVWAAAG